MDRKNKRFPGANSVASNGPADAGLDRRHFLKVAAGTGAGTLIGFSGAMLAPGSAQAKKLPTQNPHQRREAAFSVRRQAALIHLQERVSTQVTNGDESRYGDKRSSFFKGLPQNDLGEVDLSAYWSLLKAVQTGDPFDFAAIPLASDAVRKLVNPQATFAFELVGVDSHATDLVPPPAFASAEAAAEIGEIYWLALCRDIPFRSFDFNPDIAAAVADLNRFSRTVGPTVNGQVTPGTLFRGENPGDLVGPFLSQFLWHDVPYGPARIVQRYDAPVPGIDFITEYNEWLAIQRGAAPADSLAFTGQPRYINDVRALAAYARADVSFQAFLNAALILVGYGPAALDPANPYLASANQDGFITFGVADVLDLVTKAGRLGLEGAWFHKWLVHRRLRPEVMGGRIEIQRSGTKDYGINSEIFQSEAIARLVSLRGNALLPQAYPEGSPLHPSYPAGHAVLAGACTTVLKAFFNEDFVIPNPVQATADGEALDTWTGEALTIGHELNKLANNIAMGRCAGGIHYRFDNSGLLVGEKQAIGLLQDYSLIYSEDFAGFTLTKFSGEKVRIVAGAVSLA